MKSQIRVTPMIEASHNPGVELCIPSAPVCILNPRYLEQDMYGEEKKKKKNRRVVA